MFNVYKNQLSRQTGSRNLTGPKALPTIWYTYMTLVTKYQISAINSYWEKCNEKYIGRTEVKQYTPSPFGERGYNKKKHASKTKKEKPWDKKGHTKLYSDILILPIISRQIKKIQCKQIFFLKLGNFIIWMKATKFHVYLTI